MKLNYRYYALVDDAGTIWQDQAELAISEDLAVIQRIHKGELQDLGRPRRAWYIVSIAMLRMERAGESSYHLMIPREGVD
jgi:hypothetical protein